jgi:hypothetical protein
VPHCANRDTGRFTIGCCFVECVSKRSPIGIAHHRAIQPIDATQWRADRGERPFAPGRVGDRDAGGLTGCVVAGNDLVPGPVPSIVPLVVRGGNACPNPRPPGRKRGTSFDRLELDELTGWSFTSSGHAEAHRGLTVDVGEYEAPLVEMEVHQRSRGTTHIGPEVGART